MNTEEDEFNRIEREAAMRKPKHDDDDTQDYVRPCQDCEYHKNRAARWRAEAYKQAGHDVIELPWVGLTEEDMGFLFPHGSSVWVQDMVKIIEAKLKEKNAM